MIDDATASNVTLDEIARAAGVSPSTVSRILNGTASVVPAKRKAVEQAIARFSYRPNNSYCKRATRQGAASRGGASFAPADRRTA